MNRIAQIHRWLIACVILNSVGVAALSVGLIVMAVR